MSNTKELKRKIRSVKNIGQITKALQMVSAVKMKKAQERLHNSSPYYNLMNEIFENFLTSIERDAIEEVFSKINSKGKDSSKVAVVLISPSKGFAGPLLSNLTRKAFELIEKRSRNESYEYDEFVMFNEEENPAPEDENINIQLITVDKKSREFAVKVPNKVIADFPKLSNPPVFEDIVPIANIIMDSYLKGELNEIYVVYTHFLTTFSQRAVIKRILPFNFEKLYREIKEGKKKEQWYTYSENKIEFFKEFYPVFIETQLFNTVLDAQASEHSARMIAMKNATDNATDLRKQYTLEYNQTRQAKITQEILEITAAADAV